MNSSQWQFLGPNHVKSAHGFSVRRKERNLLLYESLDQMLPIEVEPGDSLGVYLTHSTQLSGFSEKEIAFISEQIGEALTFMGVRHEII